MIFHKLEAYDPEAIYDLQIVVEFSDKFPPKVKSSLTQMGSETAKNTLHLSSECLQKEVAGVVAGAVKTTKANKILIDVDDERFVHESLKGINTGQYNYKTANENKLEVDVSPELISVDQDDLDYWLGIEFAKREARSLGDMPANVLTPNEMLNYVAAVCDQYENLSYKFLSEDQLEDDGYGLIHCVGKGSEEPSKMIIMEYTPLKNPKFSYGLVGKGVTFDTGGISLKPSSKMHEMKSDMMGAGTVIGTMIALADNEVQRNVVAVLGCVENSPSGKAVKPGDVIYGKGGKSVEILNTDAEGRLVMADCLTHIQDNYEIEYLLDLATLTGSIVATLGSEAAGVFCNSAGQEVLDRLVAEGDALEDRFYQLPLWDSFTSHLKSNVADLANIGNKGCGAITAGAFLKEFVDKDVPWVHVDIAGVATQGDQTTGRVVEPLYKLIKNYA